MLILYFYREILKDKQRNTKKLESCQNIAIDGYSYSDCISSAIDDEDKYLGFLRAEIKQNIKNNNLILSEFDRDINCNENIKKIQYLIIMDLCGLVLLWNIVRSVKMLH